MAQKNEIQRLSKSAQEALGRPAGWAEYSPAPFGGMNFQSSRYGIKDEQFYWRENLIRVGDLNLLSVFDVGPQIFATGPKTIVHFFFYNIGIVNYCSVFFSDGTAVQVQVNNGTIVSISNVANTFYNVTTAQAPACVQWGTQYLLISNNNTNNDYWIWDGTLLYGSGTISPVVTITSNGRNYSSPPTITLYGGSGSGVTFSSDVNAGGVDLITVLNPGHGYLVGDQPQVKFSGGGSDTTAELIAVLAAGGVTGVEVTAAGSGYTTATVGFSGGGGSGAAATAQIGTGEVLSVSVTNPGSNYTTAFVQFAGGGGTGATATAVIQGGIITEIDVTDGGSGYTSAPGVTIIGDGTGATATAVVGGAGTIIGITMTAPGSGYTSQPAVAITGDGSGATGTAYITSGGITSVTVVDGGTGYVDVPKLDVVGGNGTAASLTALLTPTSVAYFNILNGGAGLFHDVTIVVQANAPNTPGGGHGATGKVIQQNGVVTQIIVTNAGSGYQSPPNVEVVVSNLDLENHQGYTVTTPVVEAVLVPTSIASVLITAPGQGYTQTPGIVIEPGANNAAAATVDLMPFGASGAWIEAYQQRVWLQYPFQRLATVFTNGTLLFTAPESLTDFATSDGGGLFPSGSPFLGTGFKALKTVGDYLYVISDSSVDVVSNVATSGTPATTTFNYDNTDPQAGTDWPATVQSFSRTALITNALGVFGIYGGAVTKLSADLDQLFSAGIFPPDSRALTPSAAVGTIHGQKVYCVLFTIADPEWGGIRNVMATWDERDWFITTQSPALVKIGTQVVGGVPLAYGTDGKKILPLFGEPSTAIAKRLMTKLYGASSFPMVKQAWSYHLAATDFSVVQGGISFSLFNIETENDSYPVPVQPVSFNGMPVVAGDTGAIPGCFLGLRMVTNSLNFSLQHLVLGYTQIWGGLGSPASIESE